MKPRLRLLSVWVLVILSTGCSMLTSMAPAVGNFALNLYNADTYVTKDCQWYEPAWFSKETKDWLKKVNPPPEVIADIGKVSYNNDLALELCEDKEKE